MGIEKLLYMSAQEKETKRVDPIEIFDYLDKKDGFGYLRKNQFDFLKEWNERREERDIVGVMHTGAGKTLVGLLMLQSKLSEEQLPSLYLCPTIQLVEQTIKQAKDYGIEVCKVDENISSLPIDFLNSKKILVTTFSKMFNGKSVFGVKDYSNSSDIVDVGSIVIDDAHSCVDYARQNSTISISREDMAYEKIFSLFSNEIDEQSYGKYKAILDGDASVSFQIPYWAWNSNIQDIKNILDDYCSENSAEGLKYRLIASCLEKSRCYISGKSIEITPKYNPVYQIPSFFRAKHRYILSATINSYDLREELLIEKKAIENPIISSSYIVDVGDRMILSPTKYHRDINDSSIRKLIYRKCKKENLGLIVIVPSTKHNSLKEWRALGASIINKDNMDEVFKKIKGGDRQQIVLVNRYEGVDFPGDQAHILILDGCPEYVSNKDKATSIVSKNSNHKIKLVQKIEQGLGRTVRSNSDYSVVMLLGEKLVNFVSLKSNFDNFSLATRAQLEIANELLSGDFYQSPEAAIKEILNSIDYCLNRKEEWVKYSKKKLSEVDISKQINRDISSIDLECEAYFKFLRNDYSEAESILRELLKGAKEDELGRLYQEIAEIKYAKGELTNSDNLQVSSYKTWDYAFKPRVGSTKKDIKDIQRIKNSTNYVNGFTDKASLNSAMEKILKNLVYDNDASSDLFEEAVENIGNFLGFHSTRPDKMGESGGPDNLWLSTQCQYIIECKNRETNRMNKGDSKQLDHSLTWFEQLYGTQDTFKGVIFHPQSKKDRDVQVPNNAYVIPSGKLDKLKNNLEDFRKLLYKNYGVFTQEQISDYLNKCKLQLSDFESNYLVRIN